MASNINNYVKKDSDLKSKNNCILQGQKYRITILTERLIRLEYSEDGVFEDRATSLVNFRNFDVPVWTYNEKGNNSCEIKTKYFTLTYNKEKPFKGSLFNPTENLKVWLNNSEKIWYYNHPEIRNFGGTNYSLDEYDKKLNLDKGLFSTDGFVSINDSHSYVLNDMLEFVPKDHNSIDIYLFMYRKDFGLCLKDYFLLTGKPTLIPRYVLGNWWSKNEEYNDYELKKLIDNFKECSIPLSVILLKNKWHDNENVMDFNRNLFPYPKDTIKYLHNNNIKLGVTLNPELKITEKDNKYNQLQTALKKEDSNELSVLPLNSFSLDAYFNLFVRPLEEMGVDFFGIDYNNPNDLYNLWLLNHYHIEDNNRFENKRGVLLSRNSKIAPHRYPILYSGKTKVNWETLYDLPYYNLSASNVGVSWWAHPIGGYYGGTEDNELYMRYIQFGVYSPILMLSSEGGKYYKREPWKWNIQLQRIVEDYMILRHRLIPYLYSESYIYHKTGSPLIQPLYYRYPKIYDEPIYKNEYYFGTQLLVCPITKKKDKIMNRVVQKLFIPNGMWYEFKTGKKFPGGNYYVSFYKDENYPVFCKAGGIVCLSNDVNNVAPPKNMEIHIFPGQSNTYKLYEDDGETNLYKEGYYLLTSIDYNYRSNNYTVIIRPLEGKTAIVPEIRNYKIRFRNTKQSNDVIIYVDDRKKDYNSYIDNNDFVIEINDVPTIGQLTVNCKGNDIEIDAVRLINEEIMDIISDLEIETSLKEKIDKIIFSSLTIKKKRIEVRKLKKVGLEPKFIKMFIKLLEYINEI